MHAPLLPISALPDPALEVAKQAARGTRWRVLRRKDKLGWTVFVPKAAPGISKIAPVRGAMTRAAAAARQYAGAVQVRIASPAGSRFWMLVVHDTWNAKRIDQDFRGVFVPVRRIAGIGDLGDAAEGDPEEEVTPYTTLDYATSPMTAEDDLYSDTSNEIPAPPAPPPAPRPAPRPVYATPPILPASRSPAPAPAPAPGLRRPPSLPTPPRVPPTPQGPRGGVRAASDQPSGTPWGMILGLAVAGALVGTALAGSGRR